MASIEMNDKNAIKKFVNKVNFIRKTLHNVKAIFLSTITIMAFTVIIINYDLTEIINYGIISVNNIVSSCIFE